MTTELPPRYQPQVVEKRIYAMWEADRCFRARPDSSRPPYCIMIPPPNVTDRLHVGHALNNTIQDILIRFNRMGGCATLWMPGTDHAGIATQTVVEKRILAEEGRRRTDFAREEFVARVQAWKDQYEATILGQLKAMGCSCDWERTRFTMDPVCARAVREAFFHLFADGLIYRGKRLVNWDPATQTVLADDEVEYEEVRGHFYYLRYPLVRPVEVGGERVEHITVATTRPETMLGDTAVAMNPADPRAGALVGKTVRLPIVGREIPIIADEHVVLPDPESHDEKARFSTGFLKVTPAHDPDDYDIGQRHGLPIVNVFAPDGSISDRHGWADATTAEALNLIGMDRFEAREAIVEWFRTEGLLEDVRDYVHEVGHSYRSHVPVEPYLSDQWFIAVKKPIERLAEKFGDGLIEGTDVPRNSLAGLALAPLLDGSLRFIPERYAKTYQAWLERLRDWPISRQLWWGHQIPVWHKRTMLDQNVRAELFRIRVAAGREAYIIIQDSKTGAIIARLHGADGDGIQNDSPHGADIYVCMRSDKDAAALCERCGYQRDPDVLDTWFSSALWPFSTLGWPEDTRELEVFYPGNVLCTAREIITLWVSRMVMMGQYCVGRVPFPDVFVHAMIQDGEGRKMSKSLGNGIDPLDIIESHGADAMRFTLALMTTQTQDVRMPVTQTTLPDGRTINTSDKFDGGRNFANKVWNAARFALMNLAEGAPCIEPDALELEDRWIFSRRNHAIRAVTEALMAYRFNDAAQAVYDFTWHEFCDWYLEIIKPRLGAGESGGQARAVLAFVLDTVLRLLHPFMPFLTEEVWQHLREAVPVRGIGGGPAPAEKIVLAEWPAEIPGLDSAALEADFAAAQDIVRAVRNIRSKVNIQARQAVAVFVASKDAAVRSSLERNRAFIEHLANISRLAVGEGIGRPPHSATEVTGSAEVFVPLEGLIDIEAERARLERKLADARGRLETIERKLANESFTSRAPADIVARERTKAAGLREEAAALERNLAELL